MARLWFQSDRGLHGGACLVLHGTISQLAHRNRKSGVTETNKSEVVPGFGLARRGRVYDKLFTITSIRIGLFQRPPPTSI